MEEKRMTYNAENAKETPMLPKDSILDGIITEIQDGKVKDFVKNTDKWEGSIEQPCINVVVEVKNENKIICFEHVFTYNEVEGKTEFSPSSNLGKFNKKYNKLPQSGDQIKVTTNGEGFGKIKLD
jgi:hypothetical protein